MGQSEDFFFFEKLKKKKKQQQQQQQQQQQKSAGFSRVGQVTANKQFFFMSKLALFEWITLGLQYTDD